MTNYLNTCKSFISFTELGSQETLNHSSIRKQLLDMYRTMYARSKQRQDLKNLDERLLNDVGLTIEEANFEASKPFWKA